MAKYQIFIGNRELLKKGEAFVVCRDGFILYENVGVRNWRYFQSSGKTTISLRADPEEKTEFYTRQGDDCYTPQAWVEIDVEPG